MAVLHLTHELAQEPIVTVVAGVMVRAFSGDDDIDRWLELRQKAFAGQTPAVRPWARADFAAEFTSKTWWSPERMWFAEANRLVGTITLGFRGPASQPMPVVHWLMVLPAWRRQGVGRLLLATLEAACWGAGHRRIGVETHSEWIDAERFYRAAGYVGEGV